MLAYTYIRKGEFGFREKPKPVLADPHDAIVRVTLSSICTSDLHIKHGSVPRAVPGVTVGHEMVGVVEETGPAVTNVKPGDRVTVNVETFCGKCFFCRHGYVNNCTDPDGGWALGCRIDGGQAPYVRVPHADCGLNKIPEGVSNEQALFVGDVLATGYWAADISGITTDDTVLIIGAGPTGICTLLCVLLKQPRRVIVCERSAERARFVRTHYPQVEVVEPEACKPFIPPGMGLRTPQRDSHHCRAVRCSPAAPLAGDVREKPDVQDRRRGRMPLRRDSAIECRGKD